VKEWLGGAWGIIFTYELGPLSPDLQIIESLWDVLEETLQSAGLWILYTRYWPKIDAPPDGNKCCDVISTNSCVKMIPHTPSQPFIHSLSLMNLNIIILEYGHDVFSYMVVHEIKR